MKGAVLPAVFMKMRTTGSGAAHMPFCGRQFLGNAVDDNGHTVCSMNMLSVPSRSSWSTVTDRHSKAALPEQHFPGVKASLPPLVDIPPHVVSKRLYSESQQGDNGAEVAK